MFEEYSQDDIKKMANNAIIEAQEVQNTLDTKGWEIFENILNEKLESCQKIKGIESLEELKGRQKAIEIIEGALDDFRAKINNSKNAIDILNKLE